MATNWNEGQNYEGYGIVVKVTEMDEDTVLVIFEDRSVYKFEFDGFNWLEVDSMIE